MLSEIRMSVRREKMSAVDHAWLRMDSESNLMMIVAVLMFDKPVEMTCFRETIAKHLLGHSRFRSCVIQDRTGGAWWCEQQIDLDDHLVHVRLASGSGGNKARLEELVSRLSAARLDPAKPLWQMHLVDNCVSEDGPVRQGLIVRIHHCIADGIALVGVLLSMFNQSPEGECRDIPSGTFLPEDDNPWLELMRPVTKATIGAIRLSASFWTKSMWLAVDAGNMIGRLPSMGNVASRLTLDAINLLAMRDDFRTRLKGKPEGVKQVAWSEPLPLGEVKLIGKALGGSVNDVLMASVAGAIGAYLRAKGDHVPEDADMRAMVPVNLRKAGSEQELGNAFGLVPLVLPIGMEDPVARLNEVGRRMSELKSGYQALVAMALLGVLGSTPKQLQNEVQNYFARKATAVMSNVPGPTTPLYLAGSRLEQIMFWVPQSGDIGVGVSILSYNGGVQFGLVTDASIASDPQAIIERFKPEFEKLVMVTLMSEW